MFDRSHYPALCDITHLDVSAAFPLHQRVIEAATQAMMHSCGTPGKAAYDAAIQANHSIDIARDRFAQLIGASPDEIYFVASTQSCIQLLAGLWSRQTFYYCADDHASINRYITTSASSVNQAMLKYTVHGEYDYGSIHDVDGVVMVNQLHHIYGTDSHIALLRQHMPSAKLVIDASQAAARMRIDVKSMHCDALFFSMQKIGGLAGCTVLYLPKTYGVDHTHLEPNTLPLVVIESGCAAVDMLLDYGLSTVSRDLLRWHNELVAALGALQHVSIIEQSLGASERCSGNGIISLVVDGYSATDVMMICAQHRINVRGGDHCIDPLSGRQDTVRISGYVFSTSQDIDRLVKVLQSL